MELKRELDLPKLRLPNLSELSEAARLVTGYLPPTPQYRWPFVDAHELWSLGQA